MATTKITAAKIEVSICLFAARCTAARMPKNPPTSPPAMNSTAMVRPSPRPRSSRRWSVRKCRPRRADRVEDRHAAPEHDAGHDQKPADAEEAGEGADDQADHHQADGDRRRDADGRIAL